MKNFIILVLALSCLQACGPNPSSDYSENKVVENKTLNEPSFTINKTTIPMAQGPKIDILADEHKWRFDVCNQWKANDCVDPESANCKYWEPSPTHMGMTAEFCVKAMLQTLDYCSRNEAFFQNNPRNCECVEEHYKVTTHRPNLKNKEGPLYAQQCFTDNDRDG